MRAIIVIALIVAIAGCATSGRKITQAQLDQVVSGQTTRSDLVSLFGAPTSEIYNSDGTSVLGWGYAHVGFAGIGTEVQGVSMIIGPNGTVQGYSRTGSAPSLAAPARISATDTQPSQTAQPLSEQAYKEQQLRDLSQQNLPYEEYQKRYRQIMGQ